MRIVIALLLCAVVNPSTAFARKWTDSTGKHSREGDFVELKDGHVWLMQANGENCTIAFEKLSKPDQDYVRKQTDKAKPDTPNGDANADDTVEAKFKKYECRRLTFDEAAALPSGRTFANSAVLQSISGKETHEKIKEFSLIAAGLHLTKAEDRISVIKAGVRIFGEDRLRKVGVIIYDGDGFAQYLWPTETAGGTKQAELFTDTKPDTSADEPSPTDPQKKCEAIMLFLCDNEDAWSMEQLVTYESETDQQGKTVSRGVEVEVEKKLSRIFSSSSSALQKLQKMAAITSLHAVISCDAEHQKPIKDVVDEYGPADKVEDAVIYVAPRGSQLTGKWYYYGAIRIGVTDESRVITIRIDGPAWQKSSTKGD